MVADLIHDRGRGPEIIGTRITVYNLLPHLVDETATEAYIGRLYELTADQVAAARAFVLNNYEQVMADHLTIEARIAAGNPPQVLEQAKQTHADFWSFRKRLAEREQTERQTAPDESTSVSGRNENGQVPTCREWLEERQVGKAERQ